MSMGVVASTPSSDPLTTEANTRNRVSCNTTQRAACGGLKPEINFTTTHMTRVAKVL